MRYRLLDLIVCPGCAGNLKLLCLTGTSTSDTAPAGPSRRTCRHYCGDRQTSMDCEGSIACESCWTEIEEGVLGCQRCAIAYPIADGVPRMYRNAIKDFPRLEKLARGAFTSLSRALVPEDPKIAKTRATFSQQWSAHRTGDVTWAWEIDERCDLFIREMRTKPSEFKDRLVLDAGCGNGELTNKLAALGAEVVGIDLSNSVVRANRERQSASVHFVQGDLSYIPLRKGAFDFIYSSGVLHYAADCESAFRKLADRLREKGRLYVWLYGAPAKEEMERVKSVNRKAFKAKRLIVALPIWLQRLLLYPVALLWVFRSRYRTSLDTAKGMCFSGREQLTWIERALLVPVFLYCRARDFRRVPPDTSLTVSHALVEAFNLFTPSYRSHHYFDEVKGWFGSEGFVGICLSEVRQTGFGVFGDRPAKVEQHT